jgi:hypothetical protein
MTLTWYRHLFPIRHPVGSSVGYIIRRLYINIYVYVCTMYCLEGLPTPKECGRDDYFDQSLILFFIADRCLSFCLWHLQTCLKLKIYIYILYSSLEEFEDTIGVIRIH